MSDGQADQSSKRSIYMQKTIGKVKTKYGLIEFSKIGNGSPILYLHGSLSNCNDDMGYCPLIKAGFSIITPSRPGYGETPLNSGVSAEKAANLINDLIDYLKLNVFDVIAVSGGGLTGLYLASKYPEKVKKLILASAVTKPLKMEKERYKSAKTFYGPGHKIIWTFLNLTGLISKKALVKKTYELFSTCNVKEIMYEIKKEDINAIIKFYKKKTQNIGALNDLEQIITDDILIKISAPTLIVHSKQDRAVPFNHAQNAIELIKNSELYIAETWGHFIWIGKGSEGVFNKVINFLNSSDP